MVGEIERDWRYWSLAFLGAGNPLTYRELLTLVIGRRRDVKERDFRFQVLKLLEYGLLKTDKTAFNLLFRLDYRSSLTKLLITERGGQALEYYKRMRYLRTKEEKTRLGNDEADNITYKAELGEHHPGVYWDKKQKRWRADLTKI